MADSALAIGSDNNKRYPWAFVYMKMVAEARVQNINNAGKQISCTQWLVQMACYQLCLSVDQHHTVFMNACHLEGSCGRSFTHCNNCMYCHCNNGTNWIWVQMKSL